MILIVGPILIAVPLAILAAFLAYLGAFHRVVIEEANHGPFTFVYREMVGTDMRQIEEITMALAGPLAEAGIDSRVPLDVFYPDGRTEAGFAVDGAEEAQLRRLEGHALVREIAADTFMSTRFPWRNPLSFIVGYFKVDPALARHRAAHGYKKVEALALNTANTILYLQPIVKESGDGDRTASQGASPSETTADFSTAARRTPTETDPPPALRPEQIDAVLEFLPIFEQDGYSFGTLVERPGHVPFISESLEVSAFRKALSRENVLIVFNWVDWQNELARYQSHPDALASADLLTLRKILTAHIRADRFTEGHFVGVLEDGHLIAVLRRLQAIRMEQFGTA